MQKIKNKKKIITITILPCTCGCIKQATTCTAGNSLPGRPFLFLSLIGYDKHRHCLIPLDPLPTLASERSALRMFMCLPSKIGLVMVSSLDWQVIQVVVLWNCHHPRNHHHPSNELSPMVSTNCLHP